MAAVTVGPEIETDNLHVLLNCLTASRLGIALGQSFLYLSLELLVGRVTPLGRIHPQVNAQCDATVAVK